MELPPYPDDIDTPETLLIVTKLMFEHSSKIGAFDWSVNLKQIMAALFWAAEVKMTMEGANEVPDTGGQKTPN